MKTKFTKEQLQQIKELFNQKNGSRKIANVMGVNRSTIIRAYRQLNLNSASVKTPRLVYLITNKICKTCKINKSIDQFRKRVKKDRVSYEPYCVDCESKFHKQYCKIRYRNNKIWYIQYRIKNLEKIQKYQKRYLKKYRKNRMIVDSEFKIRSKISTAIYIGLKKNNSHKDSGCWKFLNYSPKELRGYLESKFEPWMNWNNYGKYDSKIWNDDDQSTWTWQIDHIIPQSCLRYTSMEEDNFKKCWALDNLRPLSSKQNNLDGTRRTRHIK